MSQQDMLADVIVVWGEIWIFALEVRMKPQFSHNLLHMTQCWSVSVVVFNIGLGP